MSPEVIAGRLAIDHPGQCIDDETIYRYIYSKGVGCCKLWRYLTMARKNRMKKDGRRKRRDGKIPGSISIDLRPKEVDVRNTLGHWETDNIIGRQTDRTALSVTVERLTRITIITKLKNRTCLCYNNFMRNVKPTWVVFDAGGVLFNFDKAITSASEYLGITKEEFLNSISIKSKEIEINKIHYKDAWRDILSSLKMDQKTNGVLSILFDGGKYVSDTLSLVEELYNAGYSLAMLTNTWYGVTEELTSKLKEFHLFDHVFDSTELGLRKPDLEIFLYVENILSTKENGILIIDDNILNIKAAKKLKWQTFHYSIGNDGGLTSNNSIRKLLID